MLSTGVLSSERLLRLRRRGKVPSDTKGDRNTDGDRAELSSKTICLIRAPLMPLLSVEEGASILFRPFKTNTKQFKSPPPLVPTNAQEAAAGQPLILYEPRKEGEHKVEVDPMLTRWLREHQRQGVQFVFDCLMGLKDFDGYGCILADDMGLGKTLQSITILWTLLVQGIDTVPAARRALVVCPASLVNNWAAELQKWLQGRCPCTAVADTCKDKVVSKFEGFKYDRQSRVLIASYETFRAHAHRVTSVPIDLVICDEAHRLKNDKTKTSLAISQLAAKRRLLLSGTPIQNDLDEFFALVSLCNPSVVGDAHTFRRRYACPILIGREPGASEAEQELAAERLAELSSVTNLFILRRTNALLAKVLPPKIILNLFCSLTPLQVAFYQEFLKSKCCKKLLDSEGSGSSTGLTGKVLSSIQGLMKLCNHPVLVKSQSLLLTGFEKCAKLFEELDLEGTRARVRTIRPDMSGKMLLLARQVAALLHAIRVNTSDKVVLISNYTQTLDLFERHCKDSGYPCVRLDGSTSIKKRHELITKFNDPNGSAANSFVFLLSSKAGGCGVNLVGANRLVLFDPDWNPANDKQALARVWRDGQKKPCYIYRLFSAGTIEEKIYQAVQCVCSWGACQRQICKDGLSAMLVSEGENQIKDSLSTDLVKDLFQYRKTSSDTHDMLECQRCKGALTSEPIRMAPQLLDGFEEDDLLTWAHHNDLTTVPDAMLLKAIEAAHSDSTEMETLEERCPAIDKASDSVHEAPEHFQPVSFAMSCRIDYNEDDQERPEGRASTAKKLNFGGNHEKNAAQLTEPVLLSPSREPSKLLLASTAGTSAGHLSRKEDVSGNKSKKMQPSRSGSQEKLSYNSMHLNGSAPSADENGVAIDVRSQILSSGSDSGTSEDDGSSEPTEASMESSDASGSDSD
ncbi:hypothetical protein Efla_007154 [Eimeria flavescens]